MGKIQVRRGIFETNSSSVHALSVFRMNDEIEIPEKLTIDFNAGEYDFGWYYGGAMTPETRYGYLYLIAESLDDKEKEEVLEELEAMVKAAGVSEIEIKECDYKWDCYIDHSSEAQAFLFNLLNDSNLLLGFIFNPKSNISCSNDNGAGEPESVPGADYVYIKGN